MLLQRKWSRLQKWVAVLLVGLLFFNNPFVAAQVCTLLMFLHYSSVSVNTLLFISIEDGQLDCTTVVVSGGNTEIR